MDSKETQEKKHHRITNHEREDKKCIPYYSKAFGLLDLYKPFVFLQTISIKLGKEFYETKELYETLMFVSK